MKRKKRLLIISLLIVLSLVLITACGANTAPPSEIKEPVDTTKTEDPKAQSQEQPQAEPEKQTSEETSKEAPVIAQAEEKPAEPPKPTEKLPESTKEPSKPKQADEASLIVEGSGVKEFIALNLNELKSMTDAYYEDDYFSLNSYGTKEYFSFKGIRLDAVLKKAQIKESAVSLKFVASDGYEFEMTLEEALREDYIDEQDPDKKYPVIIAWHENGKDYDTLKGAPLRLVIGQKEPGDVNKPQWVQNISKIIVD